MSDRPDESSSSRGSEVLREHGAVVARVCMALLGDAHAAEGALERVAREASTMALEEGKSPLGRLMGLARVACANQLSKLPVRNTAPFAGSPRQDTSPAEGTSEAGVARAALGRLKPTEREAVVLHLVGGLDATQVAEACGIDLETARARVARGVAQLIQEETNR